MNKGDQRLSVKRLAISKDQARIVFTIAAAAAIVAFCLVASRVLISKMNHQGRVIDAKKEARSQLEINLEEVKKLESSYITFESSEESILGNSGEKNSRIVLDALPSKYDFAAVLTSIEEILLQGTYAINRLEGVDQELDAVQESSEPAPVEIPISISVNTNYLGSQQLVNDLQRSIRPMNIRSISYTGEDNDLTVDIELLTYYQPEKKLDISTEVIK